MILNINKPAGITSHDAVDKVRAITGVRKVGHGGTLDPFAEGVLVIGVGRESTKKLGQILKDTNKEYLATIEFGKTSTTGDPEGEIKKTIGEKAAKSMSLSDIEAALLQFQGEITQAPPAHSAIKIGGIPAYKLARRGVMPKLDKRKVHIEHISVIKYHPPLLKIKVVVSSGTYIRSLAEDIGRALGIGGYLKKLKRVRVGDFTLDKSIKLDDLKHKIVE